VRDPNRIMPFLGEIERVWRKVPDWRFGQFINNWLGGLERDPFYFEDNELLEELKRFEIENLR